MQPTAKSRTSLRLHETFFFPAVRIDNNNNNVSIAQRLHDKLGPYLHPAVLFHNKN